MKKFSFFWAFLFAITMLNAQSVSKTDFGVLESNYKLQLKNSPNNLLALEALGDLYGAHGKWQQASELYKQLLERNSENAAYHFKYGGVLGMMAKEGSKFKALSLISQVKKAFSKAEILDPNHWLVQWAQVEFYAQLPAILGGSFEKAWTHAEHLEQLSQINGLFAKAYISNLQNNAKNAKTYSLKGLSLLFKSECYRAEFDSKLSCIPHSNNLHYDIGLAFERYTFNLEESINFFVKYIEDYTPKDRVALDQVHLKIAKIYIKTNQIELALQNIDKALQINPDFENAKLEKKQILSHKQR
jgi:tetratricopeptide (TPR) repeat protein